MAQDCQQLKRGYTRDERGVQLICFLDAKTHTRTVASSVVEATRDAFENENAKLSDFDRAYTDRADIKRNIEKEKKTDNVGEQPYREPEEDPGRETARE